MKFLRKVLIILLIFLIFTGCGSKNSLNNQKHGSSDSVLGLYVEKTIDMVKNKVQALINDKGGILLTNDQIKDIVNLAMDFTYEVSNEQINENSATCNVTFHTYDFGKAFESLIKDITAKSFSLAISGKGGTKEDFVKLAIDIWSEKMEDMKKAGRTFSKTITLNLNKKDNEWIIDKAEEEITNAISGGLLDKLNELQDTLSTFSSIFN